MHNIINNNKTYNKTVIPQIGSKRGITSQNNIHFGTRRDAFHEPSVDRFANRLAKNLMEDLRPRRILKRVLVEEPVSKAKRVLKAPIKIAKVVGRIILYRTL